MALPSGYSECSYITIPAGGYINTGWYPSYTYHAEFTLNISATGGWYFGASSTTGWTVANAYSLGIAGSSGSSSWAGGTGNTTASSLGIATGEYHTYDISSTGVKVDGTQKVSWTGGSYVTSESPCYIGFCNNQSASYQKQSSWKRVKLYEPQGGTDTLAYDFVPAYNNSTNTYGLYDVVNNLFYTNSGTGTITGEVIPDAPSYGASYRSLLIASKKSGKKWEGEPPLTLTGATSAPATDYKLYGKTVYDEVLPGEYTQLEYLETPASSYFKSGVTSSNNLKCEITIKLTSRTTTTAHLLGDVTTSATKGYSLNTATNTGGTSRFGSDSYVGAFTLSDGKNVITTGQDGYFFNGVSQWTPAERTFTGNEFWIGAANTTNGTIQGIIGYIYGCKIWVSGVLTRNYIPVKRKSDNKVGLYDLVNNAFNAGVGTFTAGPAYIPQPTPEAPVELISVGDKTQNICDDSVYISAIFSSGKITSSTDRKVVWIPVTAGTTYTFSRSVVSDAASFTSVFTEEIPANNVSYSIGGTSTFVNHKTSGENIVGHRTAPAGAKYLAIGSYEGTNFMVVEGNLTQAQMPAYDKYGYKIPIKVVGRNLLHDDNIVTAYSATGNYMYEGYMGTASTSYDSYTASNKYRLVHVVLPAGTYTWWTDTPNCRTLRYSIGSTVSSYGNDVNYHTFTLTETSEYQMCWRNTDTSVIGDVHSMIVAGNVVPTIYTPYSTTTNIYLDSPLRQVISADGTTLLGTDYIDFGNQQVVRKTKMYVCDGTENIAFGTPIAQVMNFSDVWVDIPTTPYDRTLLCSHFKSSATLPAQGSREGFAFIGRSSSSTSTHSFFCIGYGTVVSTFKTFLATQKANGTPVTMITYLETPTTKPITLPSITLEGGATISVDTTVNASNLWIKQ